MKHYILNLRFLNRSMSEWIFPKRQKKRRLVYVYVMTLTNIYICKMLISTFSWFYHTIFKVFTTQIVYPICSKMHLFASFWEQKKSCSWNIKTHYLRFKHFIITITDDPTPCQIGLAEKYMFFKGSNNLVQIYRSFSITGNYGRRSFSQYGISYYTLM